MRKLPLLPTFGTVLKTSVIELYRSMGFTVLVSAVWFLGYLPILFLGTVFSSGLNMPQQDQFGFFIFSMVGIGFWNGLCTGPLMTTFYGLYQERKNDYPSLKLFWQVLKKVYWRSAGIHWLYSLVVSFLLFNIKIAFGSSNLLLIIPGILSIYILFITVLTSFYYHPLICIDNTLKKTIKKSFLLTMDNIGLTIWLGALLGLVMLISIGTVFPLVLIYAALVVYVTDKGFELIYQKYD